jgi:hypothetical protein
VSLLTDTVEGTRQCLPIRERGEEMPVRAIIDKSVPSALTFYSTYLVEPSPAGDMTIKKDDIVAYDHLDLKKLLTERKAAAPLRNYSY